MGRTLVRALMWAFIIAAVWALARNVPNRPDEQQREGMLDAARRYQTEQAKIQRKEDDPPPPITVDK